MTVLCAHGCVHVCVCMCVCVCVNVGLCMRRVGQNRIFTPYMTVYLMKFMQKIMYVHRIYIILSDPVHV